MVDVEPGVKAGFAVDAALALANEDALHVGGGVLARGLEFSGSSIQTGGPAKGFYHLGIIGAVELLVYLDVLGVIGGAFLLTGEKSLSVVLVVFLAL